MKPVHDAMPLIAIEGVAFDTETTGLDVREARIVQLGAISLERGRLDEKRAFESVVDPGVPIPPQSTAIHGITGQMARLAPRFADAWPLFESFRGERLLIGYSLGFDLAILEREAARSGLRWARPRSLCVRLLSSLANPNMQDYSLDGIARWLGVEIRERHQAVGDARIAGEVFLALIPHLIARGIRTVAEAERACSRLSTMLDEHHNAGWSEPFTRPDRGGAHAAGQGGMSGVDPFAFHHRVSDIMAQPPATAPASMTVHDAMRAMAERRISSLFVGPADGDGVLVHDFGIVTERDLLRVIAAEGAAALGRSVGGIATRPLRTIGADALVFRAIGLMNRLRIRHLAVEDASGALVGAVSARDLLKLRTTAAVDMQDRIEQAENPGEMGAAWSMLPAVARSLLAEELDARSATEVISGQLGALTARAAQLAERDMREAGLGEPPCGYCVLVLGSGGRGESMLAADQDNAIVFANGEPEGPEDLWFAELGRRMTDHLHHAAVPLCKGGIMARNPQWRGSSATWRDRIAAWVTKSSPEDLLNVDIFYDLRPVGGEIGLGTALRADAYEIGSGHPPFAKLLADRIRPQGAFNMLGGFRTENGRLDLKMHGLFPVVAAARALAIRHGVNRMSTSERLDGLIELPGMPESDLKTLRDGHGRLLSFLLRQQIADIGVGIPASNLVEIGPLEKSEKAELKHLIQSFGIIPELLRSAMFR